MRVRLDEESGQALMRVSRELVRGTPGNFREIHCDVRVTASEAGRRVECRITCPQFAEAGAWPTREPLRLAVFELLDSLERASIRPAGLRVVSVVGADNKVSTSFEFLDPPAATAQPAPAPDPAPPS